VRLRAGFGFFSRSERHRREAAGGIRGISRSESHRREAEGGIRCFSRSESHRREAEGGIPDRRMGNKHHPTMRRAHHTRKKSI